MRLRLTELLGRLACEDDDAVSDHEQGPQPDAGVLVAAVRKGACPKCWERLARTSEGGGVLFRQCIGCGDIWVTEAPNAVVTGPERVRST